LDIDPFGDLKDVLYENKPPQQEFSVMLADIKKYRFLADNGKCHGENVLIKARATTDK